MLGLPPDALESAEFRAAAAQHERALAADGAAVGDAAATLPPRLAAQAICRAEQRALDGGIAPAAEAGDAAVDAGASAGSDVDAGSAAGSADGADLAAAHADADAAALANAAAAAVAAFRLSAAGQGAALGADGAGIAGAFAGGGRSADNPAAALVDAVRRAVVAALAAEFAARLPEGSASIARLQARFSSDISVLPHWPAIAGV